MKIDVFSILKIYIFFHLLSYLISGSRPKESKGTVIRLPLNIKTTDITRDIGQCWNAVTETKTPTTIRCLITSPPDACIGTYDLYVETKLKDEDDEGQRFKYPGRIIYIFNPWCEGMYNRKNKVNLACHIYFQIVKCHIYSLL